MAWMEIVERPTGTIYKIRWRDGGRGSAQPAWTFDTLSEASTFRTLVELAGNHTPSADTMRVHGLGHYIVEEKPDPPAAVTVVAYCHAYLDTLECRPSTVAGYRAMIGRYIEPFFGDQLIADVDRTRLRAWQRWAVREGGRNGGPLSGRTVGHARASVLYPAFTAACRRQDDGSPGLRDWNPFDGLDAPDVVNNPVALLETPDDARRLVQAAYSIDVPTGDGVMLMMGTAMRWGEVFGLVRRAVIPHKRMAEVRAVSAVDDDGTTYVFRPEPKSDDGWRRLIYPTSLVPVVDRLRDAAGGRYGLLLPGTRAGNVWSAGNYRNRRWIPTMRRAAELGMECPDLTPHGLRHSTLTLLGEDPDVDIKSLQAFAGHADESTTAKYKHFTGRNAASINRAIDGFLADVIRGTPAAG